LFPKGIIQWILHPSCHELHCFNFTWLYLQLILMLTPPNGPGVSVTFICFYHLWFSCVLYSHPWKVLQLTQCSSKYHSTDLRNRRELITLPWGTPDVTVTSRDTSPPTLNPCERPKRNTLTHTSTSKSTHEAAIFVICRSW
jgi:hypothetical protein